MAVFTTRPARAGVDIVSVDSSGAVSFTPTAVVGPIVSAVVAGAISAASLVVIWHFVRWLFAELKHEGPVRMTGQQMLEDEAMDYWIDHTGGVDWNGNFGIENEFLGPGF